MDFREKSWLSTDNLQKQFKEMESSFAFAILTICSSPIYRKYCSKKIYPKHRLSFFMRIGTTQRGGPHEQDAQVHVRSLAPHVIKRDLRQRGG